MVNCKLEAKLEELHLELARLEAKADMVRAKITAVKAMIKKKARDMASEINMSDSSSSSDSDESSSFVKAEPSPSVVTKKTDEIVTCDGRPCPSFSDTGSQPSCFDAVKKAPDTSCKTVGKADDAKRGGHCVACVYRQLGRAGGPKRKYNENCTAKRRRCQV